MTLEKTLMSDGLARMLSYRNVGQGNMLSFVR